jgi:hypothetical protein
MKRQRWKSGDFVKIPLTDGTHCYGWIMRAGLIDFLDVNTREELQVGYLKTLPKLFTLSVSRWVITKGHWLIVGNEPHNDENAIFKWFMQDMFTKKLSVYADDKNTSQIYPATFEECDKLERMAVWDACHVEDRLIDHFGGTPEFPVDLMRPVPVLN